MTHDEKLEKTYKLLIYHMVTLMKLTKDTRTNSIYNKYNKNY